MKLKKILSKIWPIAIIIGIWAAVFWPFFKKGLLPIPADIITGVYYPWLDYKWGYEVGVPVKNPLLSDIPSLLYPWRSFAIDELKSGGLPLWNPYYFGGMPYCFLCIFIGFLHFKKDRFMEMVFNGDALVFQCYSLSSSVVFMVDSLFGYFLGGISQTKNSTVRFNYLLVFDYDTF